MKRRLSKKSVRYIVLAHISARCRSTPTPPIAAANSFATSQNIYNSVPSPSSGASQAATVAAVAAAATAAAVTRRVGFATLATERRPRADGATDGGAAAAASHSAEQARMNARRWMLRCSPPPVPSRPMAREQAIISTGCPCHSPVLGSSS